MIIAVLQTRCGLNLGSHDVYLNVAGGLRVGEPGADLAVAAALVSAHLEQPLPPAHRGVRRGRAGRRGARASARPMRVMREAAKLGFRKRLAAHSLGSGRKQSGKKAQTGSLQMSARSPSCANLFEPVRRATPQRKAT